MDGGWMEGRRERGGEERMGSRKDRLMSIRCL